MTALSDMRAADPAPAASDLDGLFRQYAGELRHLAHRGLGDWEHASDLTQDAFVRYAAATARSGTPGIHSPRAFLRQIVANLVRTRRACFRHHPAPSSLDALEDRLADTAPSAERAVSARQELAILKKALMELPPDCRTALLLNRMGGLSHPEIAMRLGVSTSMVTKHVMRAVRHCARCLAGA